MTARGITVRDRLTSSVAVMKEGNPHWHGMVREVASFIVPDIVGLTWGMAQECGA